MHQINSYFSVDELMQHVTNRFSIETINNILKALLFTNDYKFRNTINNTQAKDWSFP